MKQYQLYTLLSFDDLSFYEMSKKESIKYYDKFLEGVDERLRILKEYVHSTPGFKEWPADYSPDSLKDLYEWFKKKVKTIKYSKQKWKELLEETPDLQKDEIDGWDLSPETVSIAVDIGIYFAKVFIENHSHIEWTLDLRNKRNVDYGQPLLRGFGKLFVNPVAVGGAIAYGIARKSKNGKDLLSGYNFWCGYIEE